MPAPIRPDLDHATRRFYEDALRVLCASKIPFLVGGAYALQTYTGIVRHTRDLDVFVMPEDCTLVLEAFKSAGYQADLTFPFWLGKCRRGSDYVDVIFSSGNGVATVDREWFEDAVDADMFGHTVRLCPVEEMIWSKSFVMERERFDGADIMHLLLARAAEIDWKRLGRRFESNPHVLLAHLLLFAFVYPDQRDLIPASVRDELLRRVEADRGPDAAGPWCRGTLLSRSQYLIDLERGYKDARLSPAGRLSPADLVRWTAEAESL